MKKGDFRSRIDPKPSLNEETVRENLERENFDLLEREMDQTFLIGLNIFLVFINIVNFVRSPHKKVTYLDPYKKISVLVSVKLKFIKKK